MVPAALGGDGGGSTRLPAAISGVFGLHTTPGRIAQLDYAAPNIALLDGSSGPMTRDVRDAAVMMRVLAGPDGRDPLATLHGPVPDYEADLDKGVDGMRFAWSDDLGFAGGPQYSLPQSPKIIAAIRAAAKGFSKIGARMEAVGEAWESFWPAAVITRQGYGGLQAFDRKISPDELSDALDIRRRNWDRFAQVLETHDLMLMPTATFTAYTVEEWHKLCNSGEWWPFYTSHTFMFNWLGMPAASVPCGFVDGLPIGLQIVGPPHSEPLILRAAVAFLKEFPRNERPSLA
jgi:Asp-tRNA(Asn)/Glu-tRNA(Gln) amidotransferase A subunit family amidase